MPRDLERIEVVGNESPHPRDRNIEILSFLGSNSVR